MAQTRPNTTTDPAKAIARELTSLKRRVRDLELHPDPVSGGGGGGSMVGVEKWATADQGFPAGTGIVVVFSGDVVTGGGTTVAAPAGTHFFPGEAGWWQAHVYVEMTLTAVDSVGIVALGCSTSAGGTIRQSGQHFPVAAGHGEFYGTCSVTMEPIEITDPANTYFYTQVTSADIDGSGSGAAGTVLGFSSFGSGTRTRMGIFRVG